MKWDWDWNDFAYYFSMFFVGLAFVLYLILLLDNHYHFLKQ